MEPILELLLAAGVFGAAAGLALLIPDDTAERLRRSRVDAFSGLDVEPCTEQPGAAVLTPLSPRSR